ncbi:MAG: mannose-1-phosphate guanylyltransferase, mannose-1-phosphate guanylyltransferase [Candidatus Peregrinibacteria bacterium GW2011_GWF2_43_17]|nr:MAG: mannose-1-phosphate guanylyltransferase, mannose-1-phosphate guanylyltransferase [Candidatus Peregrinibacteria bacterium GW2011_GWF2_43_17]KKT20301.1 MAG: Mannose-1-phosphate guanylyltransferase (GDP) [Candidatus Peregrinibacteria bacterium GW2011_GWA2_43_8]HAU39442.1 mannose-1-phosphate guanylyltransferase [Candidatus Peregrinibacteria bacterium]
MYAVILAGGAGTRLWPLSTEEKPKQFHALVSDKTMLQEAFERASFLPARNIYVATNEKYIHFVKEQLPEIPEENILIEPALRDTATCIGFAAAIINKRDPESVMAVIYADHMVKDKDEFASKLKTAEAVALRDHTLNIVEVEAREPNTNFGYVEIGPEIEKIDGNSIKSFKKFTEKPDLATAKKYIESGKYLWNTGYYVWRTSDILEKYKKHLPDTYARLIKMQSSPETIAAEYPQCQKISIDYAIMEKLSPDEVRILPATLGWSDIGTWETLFKELHNSAPNIEKGEIQSVDSEGNLIYNYVKNQKINLLGIKDCAIVNTGKDILICPLKESQDVKKLQK